MSILTIAFSVNVYANNISFTSGYETYQLLNNTDTYSQSFNKSSSNANKLKNVTGRDNITYVYNPRTKNTAIMTDIIKVTLANNANPDIIATTYNIVLKNYFQYLNVAFFVISDKQDILSINTQLQKDNNIKSTEIEVIEHVNHTM